MSIRTQLTSGAVIVTGFASALLVAPPPATAATPGSAGLLAFVAPNPEHDNSLEIYTIARDGTSRTNISRDPARDQDPAWSPDGTQIAFASSRDDIHMDIWVADADGSDLRNLTSLPDTTNSGQSGTEPAWSPDGTRIAYVYQGDIWVMSATGGRKRNLTEDPTLPGAGQSPAWSPDGTTIAYVRGADIWMMNAGGGSKRQVTFTTGGLGTEKNPEWSPDGLRLVYERSGQIATMNRNGTQQTVVASGADQGGTAPVWSPEGDWVVFSSSGYTAVNGPDLFVARPDGSGIRRVPGTGADADVSPAWQPLPTSSPVPTYARMATTTTATRITVQGELFNANPGQLVRVDLQRHDGVAYRAVQSIDVTLSRYGDFYAKLGNPADTTTCRVVIRYAGDADSLATKSRADFDC